MAPITTHGLSTFTFRRILWPLLALLGLLALTAFLLHSQGRLWICACGTVRLWAGDIWSSDNSQHLIDPYSFTHIEHGILFYWVLALLLPRVSVAWRFVIAMTVESGWEVLENSAAVINRYRESTLALGYEGDTVVNALSDILFAGLGFFLAHYLGFRRTLVLLIAIEVGLILWIRDSLLLNIIMLIYPIDALRTWQMGL
jgi:hypothetical protein